MLEMQPNMCVKWFVIRCIANVLTDAGVKRQKAAMNHNFSKQRGTLNKNISIRIPRLLVGPDLATL